MYQKKDDLTALIHSLSSGEKRYLHNTFKEERSNGDAPMYLQLFDTIKNSKSQKQEYNLGFSGRVLTANKRFLLRHILKNLRSLHEEFSSNIVLNNKLSDIEIIYNHGLSDQAMVILNKATRIAREQEKFSLLLQILDWEKRLSIAVNNPIRSIESINEEEILVLKKMLQINNLVGLYSRIVLSKKKYGYAKGSIRESIEDEIIKSRDFPTEKECISEKAKFYHNLILSIYYWMTFQHLKEFETTKALLNEKVHNILISDYVAGVHQHITSCVCLLRFEEALQGLKISRIYIDKNYSNDSNPNKQNYIAHYVSYNLIIYGYKGALAQLSETLRYGEYILPECTSINNETRHVVLGNMMNGYLAIGDLENSERIWHTLFNLEGKDLRKDIFADLFIFRIFFLIQSKEFSLIMTICRSALRYYRISDNPGEQFKFEYPIALLFNKPHEYEDKKTVDNLLKKCASMVNIFIDQLKLPIKFQEHYTRYLIWIQSLLDNEPYYKTASQWHSKITEKEQPKF